MPLGSCSRRGSYWDFGLGWGGSSACGKNTGARTSRPAKTPSGYRCRTAVALAELEFTFATPGPPGKQIAAVDGQRAAGDIGIVRIDQKRDASSDFFGPGQAAKRQRRSGSCQ